MIPLTVRSPRDGETFRIRPEPEGPTHTLIVHDDDGKDYYVQKPDLIQQVIDKTLPEHRSRIELCETHLCVNTNGEYFIWLTPAGPDASDVKH